MRVVSWNLGVAFSFRRTHDQAWQYLAELDPDIALLQEVDPPAWTDERWAIEARPVRGWGSAIAAKPDLKLKGLHDPLRSEPRRDPYLLAGTVVLPDSTELVIVSVHSRIGKAPPEDQAGLESEAIRRPHESAPHHNDVDYALVRRLVEGRRFLVSGDWNIARLWDETHRGTHEADFFTRADADGWIECYQSFHPEGEGRTWYHGNDAPCQLDHAFCDPVTAERLRSCEIVAHPAETLALSDHAPLVVEFDI
jgi:exonuclease III